MHLGQGAVIVGIGPALGRPEEHKLVSLFLLQWKNGRRSASCKDHFQPGALTKSVNLALIKLTEYLFVYFQIRDLQCPPSECRKV